MGKIAFNSGHTLLFIGDSITDAGRRERPYAPLGWGYVHFAANFLQARYPDLSLTIHNRGISGDTTGALLTRWDSDCIALQPDIVSLMIGINDLWRKFSETTEKQRLYIAPDEFHANLAELLRCTRDTCGAQLILMEPFMFCDDPTHPMLRELPAYIDTVHALARDWDAVLVPVHTAWMRLRPKRPAAEWAQDTVHPSDWAHAWIAEQWLQAVLDPA